MAKEKIILGAGITGLAAGMASGFPVFEAGYTPGGICSSYYVRPGEKERLSSAPADREAYRFEIGGGHWIFGGDPLVHCFIRSLGQVKTYTRHSAVYFPEKKLYVPYPLQHHLRYLDKEIAMKSLQEIVERALASPTITTMYDWLEASFGPTLCSLFFHPFHNLYTAGLWKSIAPQDEYKSPGRLALVIEGAFSCAPSVGYNATYVYPTDGLDCLAQRMAAKGKIHYGKEAIQVDIKNKEVYFSDGSTMGYDLILSTIPLNKIMHLTGLSVPAQCDPCSSVLVINLGARRGPQCPEYQWVYLPQSQSGFHRLRRV
jgi:protoporphyrinogen oxidase